MDLLEYARELVSRGHANHNSHVVHLQELVKEQPNGVEVKPKTGQESSQVQPKTPNFNTFFLIGGLVLLISSVLAIGY
jgi:hypothetical protein